MVDFRLSVRHFLRFGVELFSFHHPFGIVDVELEIRHNGQMIPHLVRVFRLLQFGKQGLHRADYSACACIALIAVFQSAGIIDHPLEISAIFRKHELFSPGVVCEHKSIVFTVEGML